MLNTKDNKVTYLDTLHPDDAHGALSKEEGEYAGKWDAVWAEAVLVDDEAAAHDQPDSQQQQGATPEVPVGEAQEEQQQEGGGGCDCHKHNVIVIILGWTFVIAGVATTFGMELAASIIFLLAAGFNWIADKAGQAGGPMVLFQALFSFLTAILCFVDTVVLLMGTFVTELLAWVAYGICCLFGGCLAGAEWHQSVRRLCHLTRWAFRGFHDNWTLKRGFPWASSCSSEEGDNTDNQEQAIQEVMVDNSTIVVGPEDVVIEEKDNVKEKPTKFDP